jgi:AraC-like DNA-binding protein
MSYLPAASTLAILDGLEALGLDLPRIRREAAVPRDVVDPEALLPESLIGEIWRAAFAQAPRTELGVEVGLAVPLGAFGVMDYLAASSDTVGEAFTSLARLFPSVVPGRSIEIVASAEAFRVTLLPGQDTESGRLGDDFTFGIMLRHFRAFSSAFPLLEVELARAEPSDPAAFARLFEVPTRFGRAAAALRLSPDAPSAVLKSRDPLLRRTLEAMASRLGLGAPAAPLEMVIRSRLRELLPAGAADATTVARSLSLSTRTLHRKLAELGRSYSDLVDDFRRSEAERLLTSSAASLTEVALSLGFAEQSAFSRAFKRWTELSPSEWRASRAR